MPVLKQGMLFANRYKLIKKLGSGGYSEVWLAEDAKAGNMPVAVKIFAPEKGLDEKGLELFSKEYALVFNLKHPGLLRASHFDDHEGSPYLVMPYCRNGSALSRAGEMDEKQLAVFMQQAASALAYLHKQNPPIIHQDIKPDNFLIDDEGNYLLADFGISSRMRRTLTKSMGKTSDSSGTIPYMAPERFGKSPDPTSKSDIWALGVTLYELLTGNLPFGDHGGLIQKNGAEIPDLPDGFSAGINDILTACMASLPVQRPDARQLAEVAETFLKTGKWPHIVKYEENCKTKVKQNGGEVKEKHSWGKMGFINSLMKMFSVNNKSQWLKWLFIALIIVVIAGIPGFLFFRSNIPTVTAKSFGSKYWDKDQWKLTGNSATNYFTWNCNTVCLPDKTKISSSSVLLPQGYCDYYPENIADDNPATAWVEGAKEYGIGQYIEIMDWAICDAKTIWILNGYQSSPGVWENNSRIKKMLISFNDKDICYVKLADKMGRQEITLPVEIKEKGKFRFTIIEVYPGAKYKDTAISGLYSCND